MFELRVLNGLHEGAALPLTGEAWAMGNAAELDLQLCDSEIRTLHAQLMRQDDDWQLIPREGDVYFAQGKAITGPSTLSLNQPFQLSGVWLVVADSQTPWSSSSFIPIDSRGIITSPKDRLKSRFRTTFPRWVKPASFSLLAIMVITFLSWVLQPTRATEPALPQKPVITDAVTLVSTVEKKLQERELEQQVLLKTDNSGIRLEGELSAEEMAIVKRLMTSLKREYDIRVPFSNATHLHQLTLPFRIVEITAGAHANIVTDNGQRLFIGDEASGYKLSRITKNTVEFTGPEPITVNW